MSSVQLNLVVIRAADIDRSAEFYRLLGLDFIKHRHGVGPEHYAAELGTMVFEVYPRQNAGGGSSALRVGFQVGSVDATVAVLEGAGARIVSAPKDSPWGRRAVVDDPDGHRVELTQAHTSDA